MTDSGRKSFCRHRLTRRSWRCRHPDQHEELVWNRLSVEGPPGAQIKLAQRMHNKSVNE